MNTIKIDNIRPNQDNPRTISPDALDKLKASIERDPQFMALRPIVIDETGTILGGNQRHAACVALGMTEIPATWVRSAAGLTDEQRQRFILLDNGPEGMTGSWDEEMLANLFPSGMLDDLGFDLADLDLDGLGTNGETDPDAVPDAPAEPDSQPGTLYQLGAHRLLCGDCTAPETIATLLGGRKACLLHADPPYGMGKEKDGVENDNLYREKLDDFQMNWWRAVRPHLDDNASAYIWGNAADIWRLWYKKGLADLERISLRNEIVWQKGEKPNGHGVGVEGQRCYYPSERALFLMFGEQVMSTNADHYLEGWEPIRSYLDEQRQACGWSNKEADEITGTAGMAKHYFTRSQWLLPTREKYEAMQNAAQGNAFKREYDEIKREYDEIKREWMASRAWFDNTHDNMTDVWIFPRVIGEDRHGHATPKPVAMIERAIKSIAPESMLVVDPFLGSGSTLIAAESTGRVCYGTEISPAYCDVIRRRWAEFVHGEGCDWISATPCEE